jgi:hypothetical protein
MTHRVWCCKIDSAWKRCVISDWMMKNNMDVVFYDDNSSDVGKLVLKVSWCGEGPKSSVETLRLCEVDVDGYQVTRWVWMAKPKTMSCFGDSEGHKLPEPGDYLQRSLKHNNSIVVTADIVK